MLKGTARFPKKSDGARRINDTAKSFYKSFSNGKTA